MATAASRASASITLTNPPSICEYVRVFTLGRSSRLARALPDSHSEPHMKIASQRTLDDVDIAAKPRVQRETWDAIAHLQTGTMGTLRQAKLGEGGSMHDA